MDIFNAYRAINETLVGSLNCVNMLTQVEEEKELQHLRLEESPFILTEETRRTCNLVTAHDLFEYRSNFYSIKLREDTASWLLDLLAIDEEN